MAASDHVRRRARGIDGVDAHDAVARYATREEFPVELGDELPWAHEEPGAVR